MKKNAMILMIAGLVFVIPCGAAIAYTGDWYLLGTLVLPISFIIGGLILCIADVDVIDKDPSLVKTVALAVAVVPGMGHLVWGKYLRGILLLILLAVDVSTISIVFINVELSFFSFSLFGISFATLSAWSCLDANQVYRDLDLNIDDDSPYEFKMKDLWKGKAIWLSICCIVGAVVFCLTAKDVNILYGIIASLIYIILSATVIILDRRH